MGTEQFLLDRAEKQGIEKGIEKGIEQGIEKGIEKERERSSLIFAQKLILLSDFSDEKIANLAMIDVDLVKKLRKKLANKQ